MIQMTLEIGILQASLNIFHAMSQIKRKCEFREYNADDLISMSRWRKKSTVYKIFMSKIKIIDQHPELGGADPRFRSDIEMSLNKRFTTCR